MHFNELYFNELKRKVLESEGEKETIDAVTALLGDFRVEEGILSVYNDRDADDYEDKELTRMCEEAKKVKEEILALLSSVRAQRSYIFLYYVYVQGRSVAYVGDRLGVSRRSATRMHKRALLALAESMKKNAKCMVRWR